MGSLLRYVEDQPITFNNETFIDSAGEPITDATGVIRIRRDSDYFYFNGATFAASPTNIAMNEIDETNSKGDWDFNIPAGFKQDEYVIFVEDTAKKAANFIQQGKIIVDDIFTQLLKLSAAGAVGRSEYDPITSLLTLYKWDDDTIIIATFPMKKADGTPAGNEDFFKKLLP